MGMTGWQVDWVAWVGTYEDLMEQNDGQCHILLCEDWANNRYLGDTGYTGMVVLPDGTFCYGFLRTLGQRIFTELAGVVTAAVIMSRLTYVTSSRRNLNWQM